MTIKQRHISPFSSILKGEFITNQISRDLIPLLILIVFLALINIKSSFNAENLLKKSINLEREVADLRLTYITSKSDLMILYRRSNFENVVKDLGLKTSILPPEIIER